eukprot:CAMPEP_0119287030 /NCGR_PEP_ID=MMETSP1329-20130426/34887_1 /TAXON_ID=114041 /ORGANISM="Genus nov. species nov., Strain RCC1024" /LENGTH=169 /DNA_ID=CAMNT_0007287783 /DNA_START=78 /DNA_END=583 /DNA_ORIENTATION=+
MAELLDWGSSRRAYYGGDTAEIEIGQSTDDAVEEEALAAQLVREQLEALDEDDFALDDDSDDEAPPAVAGVFGALGGAAPPSADPEVLRSYLREAREALEGLGPEGGSPEERVLRDVREQAALGLAADVGFVFLLEAEGADATGHPVFRRIVRAKRALDAALALEGQGR